MLIQLIELWGELLHHFATRLFSPQNLTLTLICALSFSHQFRIARTDSSWGKIRSRNMIQGNTVSLIANISVCIGHLEGHWNGRSGTHAVWELSWSYFAIGEASSRSRRATTCVGQRICAGAGWAGSREAVCSSGLCNTKIASCDSEEVNVLVTCSITRWRNPWTLCCDCLVRCE